MTTLIAVYNSDGCVGRCDAKCYNAVTSYCECVCGGANHGVGMKQAIQQAQDHFKEWIKEYAETMGLDKYKAVISDDVFQLPLFDLSK